MLKLKLIQRLIIFACLLLVLNVVTLHFQSQHQLLETVFSTTDAQGRLNSGTELILRDHVTGIAETGTFESFSNESVRTLMDYFTSNRKARTVVYRPSPINPEMIEHNDYELSLAIETHNRWLFISDVTFTLFNEQFKHTEHQSYIWFFKWRTL